jgi:hypothetical protein
MLAATRGIRNTSPGGCLISHNIVYQSAISNIYDTTGVAVLEGNIEISLKVVYERIKGGVFLMSLFDEPSTLLLRRNTPWRKIT